MFINNIYYFKSLGSFSYNLVCQLLDKNLDFFFSNSLFQLSVACKKKANSHRAAYTMMT